MQKKHFITALEKNDPHILPFVVDQYLFEAQQDVAGHAWHVDALDWLATAISNGHHHTIKALLDSRLVTELDLALASNDLQQIAKLAKKDLAAVWQVISRRSHIPVEYKAICYNPDLVLEPNKVLAELDFSANQLPETLLYLQCLFGATYQDHYFQTAEGTASSLLAKAIKANNRRVVSYLLEHGANPNQLLANEQGLTPCLLAIDSGADPFILARLMAAGAELGRMDAAGRNAYHRFELPENGHYRQAAAWAKETIASTQLEHWAYAFQFTEVFNAFRQQSADKPLTINGDEILEFAVKTQQLKLLQVLLSHAGDQISQQQKDKAFELAMQLENSDFARSIDYQKYIKRSSTIAKKALAQQLATIDDSHYHQISWLTIWNRKQVGEAYIEAALTAINQCQALLNEDKIALVQSLKESQTFQTAFYQDGQHALSLANWAQPLLQAQADEQQKAEISRQCQAFTAGQDKQMITFQGVLDAITALKEGRSQPALSMTFEPCLPLQDDSQYEAFFKESAEVRPQPTAPIADDSQYWPFFEESTTVRSQPTAPIADDSQYWPFFEESTTVRSQPTAPIADDSQYWPFFEESAVTMPPPYNPAVLEGGMAPRSASSQQSTAQMLTSFDRSQEQVAALASEPEPEPITQPQPSSQDMSAELDGIFRQLAALPPVPQFLPSRSTEEQQSKAEPPARVAMLL